MRAAFVGAHGTGKTSVIRLLREIRPTWTYFDEATRKVMPFIGYQDPYLFVEEFGIAFYEAIILSHWAVLATKGQLVTTSNIVIVDRSPLDNLAYYYLLRKPHEVRYENVLERLARHYIDSIDLFVLFPAGLFPFEPDPMQRVALQKEYDLVLRSLLKKYQVRVYEMKAVDISARVDEVLSLPELSEQG